MTGPEHYREAERLLTEAGDLQADYEDASVLPLLARAQVHALLASAASVVPASVDNEMLAAFQRGWRWGARWRNTVHAEGTPTDHAG
jgi:hypothetical protein